MKRFSSLRMMPLIGAAVGLSLVGAALAHAQPSRGGDGRHDGRRPVYQRHAFERKDDKDDDDKRRRRHHRPVPFFVSPPVSAGWFQRPYPYHLDYYKMRYGGSYAPYFGNLYGPPQVVTAPPYYGPYYGGYDGESANGYGPGYGAMPGVYPPFPNGMMMSEAIPGPNASEKPAEQAEQKSTKAVSPVLKP